MIIKSFNAENNIGLLEKFKAILIYGENEGLKNDLIDNLKKIKNADIINLFSRNLDKDNLFNSEISNLSLFEKKKIIFLNSANDTFLKNIEEFLDMKNNNLLVISADILTKRSKLRSFFENNKNTAIIPCYKDTKVNLSIMLKNTLKNMSGLTPNSINQILNKTGADRTKVKEEIQKIKLYFHNKNINETELEKLLNYNFEINLYELVNDILLNNKTKVNDKFEQLDISREEVFIFFSILNNQLEKIKFVLINHSNQKNINISTLNKLNINVFWKEQDDFIKICNNLNLKLIQDYQKICYVSETMMKKNYDLNYLPIFKKTILDLVQN